MPQKVSSTWSEIFNFFSQDFFGIFKNGQKKCPKLKNQNILCKKICFVTIIEILRKVTKKIIFNLLR